MEKPELRNLPYPYRAALSICNDIDGTDTRKKYLEIHSYMLEEIGIMYGNSFFPFSDKNEFALFSGNISDRNTIIEHIQKGYFDSIHSYGDKEIFNRSDAEKTIKELIANNCRVKIWIDHKRSPSNLCKYRFFGKGDIPEEKEYHFDLTRAFGIKYIWTERLTNIIGQGRHLSPVDLFYIFDKRHPFNSIVNIAKTIAKIGLEYFGSKKYNFFIKNELVKIAQLYDKQNIFEFIRFNNYFNRKKGETFYDLPYLLSDKVIKRLKKVGGYSIVYVHLGKNFILNCAQGEKAVRSLKRLKKEHDDGNIYVDSTINILDYYIRNKYLEWYYKNDNDTDIIVIKGVNDPLLGFQPLERNELKGLCFYIPDNTIILHEGRDVKKIRYNPPDFTGRKSVSIL